MAERYQTLMQRAMALGVPRLRVRERLHLAYLSHTHALDLAHPLHRVPVMAFRNLEIGLLRLRLFLKTAIACWSLQTPTAENLLPQHQAAERLAIEAPALAVLAMAVGAAPKSIRPRSSAVYVRSGSHAHTICAAIYGRIPTIVRSCVPCAARHLPASMIARGTRAFTLGRKNLCAVDFLPVAQSKRVDKQQPGVVGGVLRAPTP